MAKDKEQKIEELKERIVTLEDEIDNRDEDLKLKQQDLDHVKEDNKAAAGTIAELQEKNKRLAEEMQETSVSYDRLAKKAEARVGHIHGLEKIVSERNDAIRDLDDRRKSMIEAAVVERQDLMSRVGRIDMRLKVLQAPMLANYPRVAVLSGGDVL